MNRSIIVYILGQLLKIEAVLLLVPCIVAGIYGETQGFYYLGVAVICFLLGLLMTHRKPKSFVFYLKEGCVTTALCWIVLSLVGCIPFIATGEIPRFTDALFETISGFTTTGATILNDVEALCHCTLFWRSFTHWIGGMGVLVFLLAIIPMTGGSHMNLMRAESPGPSVGKLVPKVKTTARILYGIYLGITLIEIILLLVTGMPAFDAVTLGMGTAGTGGFGVLNDSLASYAPHLQWIVAVFMVLFGINFNFYYFILFKQGRKALEMSEVKVYLLLVATATGIIFWNIRNVYATGFESLTHSFFQVASLMTSTGFATADFDVWPQASKTMLVIIMFIGACAGSTGGGIKVSRIMLGIKTVLKELNSYIHPKSIKKIKLDGKPVEHEVIRALNVYFLTFFMLFGVSLFVVSLNGYDFTTNFTAVLTTINNMGPGFSLVGPTCNFSFLSDLTKYMLMIDMLAGRLELFPLLILFHPAVWKEMFALPKKKK